MGVLGAAGIAGPSVGGGFGGGGRAADDGFAEGVIDRFGVGEGRKKGCQDWFGGEFN